jgi:hypothetical protein
VAVAYSIRVSIIVIPLYEWRQDLMGVDRCVIDGWTGTGTSTSAAAAAVR